VDEIQVGIGHEFRLQSRSRLRACVVGTSRNPEAGVQRSWCRPRCCSLPPEILDGGGYRESSIYLSAPFVDLFVTKGGKTDRFA